MGFSVGKPYYELLAEMNRRLYVPFSGQGKLFYNR